MNFKTSKQFFKYCPHCGQRYQPEDGLHCRQCDFIFYQNSKPTVTAFMLDCRHRLLLVRRAVKPKQGWWDMAGGFLKEGERPLSGLRREIREELGVAIAVERLLGIYISTYNHGYRCSTLNIIYVTTIRRGKLHSMDDVSDWRWFFRSDIPWSRLAFPWMRLALRDYYIK